MIMGAIVEVNKIQDETYAAKVRCPHCGSEMAKDMTDNPHDVYTGHFTCQNRECDANITVRY